MTKELKAYIKQHLDKLKKEIKILQDNIIKQILQVEKNVEL